MRRSGECRARRPTVFAAGRVSPWPSSRVPGWLSSPALGDRHLPAAAEGLVRDTDRRCRLTALELVRVDEPEDAGHEFAVVAGSGDGVGLLPLLDVELEDAVENLIGRQGVLVGLVWV